MTSWRGAGVGALVPVGLIALAALIAIIASVTHHPRGWSARGGHEGVPPRTRVHCGDKEPLCEPGLYGFVQCYILFILCIPTGCEYSLQQDLNRLCYWENRSLSLKVVNSAFGSAP